MTPGQFLCYMAVNTLVALGTIGSVVIALFGSRLRAKWWPPVFNVEVLVPPDPTIPITITATGAQVDVGRYYHLTVKNARMWSIADNVTLNLVRIEEAGPDGEPQIKWAGNVPVRCRNQEFYPLQQKIGSPIDYDLCSVTKTKPTLSLMPVIPANNLPPRRTERCEFVASFQVKSSQCESDLIRVRISWNGKWDDGDAEMGDNLKIKVL
jgi:hypothetical protein